MLLVPSFSRLFSTSHLHDSFGRQTGAMLLVLRLSQTRGIEKGTEQSGILENARHLFKIARNVRAVKRVALIIATEIDRRLDPMPYKEIKALGEIEPGTEPCAFVRNPQVVTPENWQNFTSLAKAEILPFPTTVAFANVLAEKVMAERDACHVAQHSPKKRLQAKQSHIELSALATSYIGAIVNPELGRKMSEHASELTYDFVAASMPDLVRYGEVLQLHDDLSDILKDKRDEEVQEVVSPNAVLADMAQGQAFADLEDYFAMKGHKLPAGEFISIAALPGTVRSAWKRSVEDALDAAGQVADPRSAKCLRVMISGLPGPMVPKA